MKATRSIAENGQDVCDRVGAEDSGFVIPRLCDYSYDQAKSDFDRAKDAVASMIKRLAHRNANVQLYTLEVWPSSKTSRPQALIHRK